MRKIGILHNNPKSAAVHLMAIGDNPLEWWNDAETKKVRLIFDNICGAPSEDTSLDLEWSRFFKKMLKKSEKE